VRKPSRGGAYHWREYQINELLPVATGEHPIVLLLGCGDAGEKPLLAEMGYCPFGMDIRRSEGLDVLADAHSLPFADASIDLVISMQVFEHLRAPWLAAGEVSRVLRPCGWFVGSCSAPRNLIHRGSH
jgi:SAM-dependent methyltransferase